MAQSGGKRPWYTTHIVRDWIAFFLGVWLIVFDVTAETDHTLEHDIAMWTVALVLMGMASASRMWTWTRGAAAKRAAREPDNDDDEDDPLRGPRA